MNAPTITDYQVGLLHHTLGLSERRREPWRNHFMAGDGHHDQANLLDLVNAGMMTRAAVAEWMGHGDLFRATDAGRDHAIAALPVPRKRNRYEQYLDAECCESFGEWLVGYYNLPKFEMQDDFGKRREYRMVSPRAKGEWKLSMKDAKVSYKAALAATRPMC
ncbi:hypothetical protein AAKU55_005275 [Oxalobacteraceae bacterium GrIS 1.11]